MLRFHLSVHLQDIALARRSKTSASTASVTATPHAQHSKVCNSGRPTFVMAKGVAGSDRRDERGKGMKIMGDCGSPRIAALSQHARREPSRSSTGSVPLRVSSCFCVRTRGCTCSTCMILAYCAAAPERR